MDALAQQLNIIDRKIEDLLRKVWYRFPGVSEWPGDRLFGVLLALFFLLSMMSNNSRVGRVATGAGIIFLGAFWLWERRVECKRLLPIAAIIGSLWMVQLLSGILGLAPGHSLETWITSHSFFPLLLVSTAIFAITRPRQIIVLQALLWAASVAAFVGIILYFVSFKMFDAGLMKKEDYFIYTALDEAGNTYYRAKGLMGSYTGSAMICMISIPLIIGFFIHALSEKNRGMMCFYGVLLLMQFFFLLITYTRGMWVGTALLSFALLFAYRVAISKIVLLGAIFAVFLFAIPQTRERASTLIRDIDNPDLLLSSRVTLWKQGWPAFAENPILGIGYSGDIFKQDSVREVYAVKTDLRWESDVHQMYLQTLTETGISGAVVYMALLAYLIIGARRTLKREDLRGNFPATAYVLLILIFFLFLGLFYTYNKGPLAMILWTLAGTLLTPRLIDDQSTNR